MTQPTLATGFRKGLSIMEVFYILVIKAIYIIQSKIFFYLVIGIFTISNIVYKRVAKEIKQCSNRTENMFSGEIWEMIKEESSKGSKKAKVAVVAYYLQMLCLSSMVCIFLSMNI